MDLHFQLWPTLPTLSCPCRQPCNHGFHEHCHKTCPRWNYHCYLGIWSLSLTEPSPRQYCWHCCYHSDTHNQNSSIGTVHHVLWASSEGVQDWCCFEDSPPQQCSLGTADGMLAQSYDLWTVCPIFFHCMTVTDSTPSPSIYSSAWQMNSSVQSP